MMPNPHLPIASLREEHPSSHAHDWLAASPIFKVLLSRRNAMCHPGFLRSLSRRGFLQASAAASAGAAATAFTAKPASSQPSETPRTFQYSRVVDLTHTLFPGFPNWGQPSDIMPFFEMTPLGELEPSMRGLDDQGIAVYHWSVVEHVGTHIDAPLHFVNPDDDLSAVYAADQIPPADLAGPLAVIDIRAKAEENPNAQLTLDDLKAWEDKHGELPDGCMVAMNSGWDERVPTEGFLNLDPETNRMRYPGFHVEAVEFMLEERDVKGLMVDTLSLDSTGASGSPVHYRWLGGTNRWGVEVVANLGELPPNGAFAVVGAPKIKGSSGGPTRVLAFV
jgi:kynurenine formamidase